MAYYIYNVAIKPNWRAHKNEIQLQKLERTKCTWSHVIKVEGDESNGCAYGTHPLRLFVCLELEILYTQRFSKLPKT